MPVSGRKVPSSFSKTQHVIEPGGVITTDGVTFPVIFPIREDAGTTITVTSADGTIVSTHSTLSVSITVNLPASPTDGEFFIIKNGTVSEIPGRMAINASHNFVDTGSSVYTFAGPHAARIFTFDSGINQWSVG